jgi:hypothetical protein
VHGRSTASDDALDLTGTLFEGTSEDSRRMLDLALYGDIREQSHRELLLGIVLASQAAQIQDLTERLAQLDWGWPSNKPICNAEIARDKYPTSARPAYLCGIWKGDRRGSNPRPSLEPQSDAARYSPSWCVRHWAYL